jgi:hypothetical protein
MPVEAAFVAEFPDLPNFFVGRAPVTVDIKGLIHRMPSPPMLRKDWKLSKEQLRVFANLEIYIAAVRCEVTATRSPVESGFPHLDHKQASIGWKAIAKRPAGEVIPANGPTPGVRIRETD